MYYIPNIYVSMYDMMLSITSITHIHVVQPRTSLKCHSRILLIHFHKNLPNISDLS